MRHAGNDALAVVERDQRRPVHLSEDEAARAVDGIDHPRVARGAFLPAELLAANAVIGKRARDSRANHGFSRAVGDGYRIVAARAALVGDVQRNTKMREDRLAGGERRSIRELEDIGRADSGHAERGTLRVCN